MKSPRLAMVIGYFMAFSGLSYLALELASNHMIWLWQIAFAYILRVVYGLHLPILLFIAVWQSQGRLTSAYQHWLSRVGWLFFLLSGSVIGITASALCIAIWFLAWNCSCEWEFIFYLPFFIPPLLLVLLFAWTTARAVAKSPGLASSSSIFLCVLTTTKSNIGKLDSQETH